jgi:hypothetical protein
VTIRFNSTARDAQANAVITEAGANAYIRIYTGTQPANPAAAATGTLLAELRGNATAFGTVTAGTGTVTLSATVADTSADAAGTAGWFRVFKSNGTTAVIDGSAGTTGTDLILNTATFTLGGNVSITSGSIAVSPD